MDILAALAESPVVKSEDRCKVGRWLDSIPKDTPGRAELVATFETADRNHPQYRNQADLTAITVRLGHSISRKVVGDHVRSQCRCYGYSA
jgi:hypothetical protein